MDEYGSSATSVHTIDSGSASLSIATARGTMPSGLYASSPRLVLRLSSTFGKRTNDFTPTAYADLASATMDSRLCRSQPGIDAITSLCDASWMNSG